MHTIKITGNRVNAFYECCKYFGPIEFSPYDAFYT